jgi:hypothetical protein
MTTPLRSQLALYRNVHSYSATYTKKVQIAWLTPSDP